MHRGTLIYLRPADTAGDPRLQELTDQWRLLALAPGQRPAESAGLGLVRLATSLSPPRWRQSLASLAGVEWIALIEPALLELSEFRDLIAGCCWDFLPLPADPGRLRDSLQRLQALRSLPPPPPPPRPARHGLVGEGRAMQRVQRALARMAAVDAPVLIQGESGTGKELAAQAVHAASARSGGPFVAVNCGALPPGLIQSELFGHERGAFTGAQQRKIGRIEAAQGGTVFLDEIGDLAPDLQVNLLRFLQEEKVERLGSHQPIAVNVRVIAATHVDLEQAVAAGRFRADLYYRLNVLRLEMPALRERPEDVELLAWHFFRRYAPESGPRVRGFSHAALTALRGHSWPGNIRELLNRVRRALVMCEGRLIEPADLGLEGDPPEGLTLARARAEAERVAIRRALIESGHNLSQAASRLGVARVTLYRLLDKHRIGGAPRVTAAAALDYRAPVPVLS